MLTGGTSLNGVKLMGNVGVRRRLHWRFFWLLITTTTTTPQPFYGPFSGTTRVSRCQKRTSGLYGARGD